MKPGLKAVEVGATQFAQSPQAAYAFRLFGRPPRTTACDCERSMEPALPQELFLMTDPVLLGKFNQAAGRVQTLIKSKLSDDEVLDELVLSTLTRLPTTKERQFYAEHRQKVRSRNEAITDMMWVLINTREFILNH